MSELRTEVIRVRLTPREKARLVAKCRRTGETFAAFVRRVAFAPERTTKQIIEEGIEAYERS